MNLTEVPTPMSLREAVEAAKIILPHVGQLRQHRTGLPFVKDVIALLMDDAPSYPFRLLALMFHGSPEEVALALDAVGPSGLPTALVNGLAANPVPDLIEAARLFGLTEERWNG